MSNGLPIATKYRIGLMAPKDKIVDEKTGFVGIGTDAPEKHLHIQTPTGTIRAGEITEAFGSR